MAAPIGAEPAVVRLTNRGPAAGGPVFSAGEGSAFRRSTATKPSLQPRKESPIQKMMINEVELAERWNLSPKTLRDEVMGWARRWLQDAKDQGIEAKADPAGQHRSLQQALASLPA